MRNFSLKNRVKQRPMLYMIFGAFLILVIFNLGNILDGIYDFFNALSPFFMSIAIAYIIYPIVQTVQKFLDKIHKFKINKAIAITIVYAVFVTLLVIAATFLIPELYQSITEIFHKIPSYLEQVKEFLENFNIDTSQITMQNLEKWITEEAQNYQKYLPEAINTATSIIGGVFDTLIGIVFSIYILADKDRIFKYIKHASTAIFGEEKTDSMAKNFAECGTNINKYLVGSIIDSLIIGVVVFVILTILKMPYALLVGCIVCITNIIPNFGPFIGAVPSTLLYLSIDLKMALTFVIIILIIQQIDGNIIVPKIIGTKMGIRPLIILPAIILGGHYFGPIGMVLGVPVISTINLYLCRWFDARIEQRKKQKEAEENNPPQSKENSTEITITVTNGDD